LTSIVNNFLFSKHWIPILIMIFDFYPPFLSYSPSHSFQLALIF